jgi:hypothetical protein
MKHSHKRLFVLLALVDPSNSFVNNFGKLILSLIFRPDIAINYSGIILLEDGLL